MFPYRFQAEPAAAAPPAAAPAATPTAAPASARRAVGAVPVLALALLGGVIGGGAAGAALRPGQAPSVPATVQLAAAPPSVAQPAARPAPPAAPANVAGAVFAKINPAVVQVVVSGRAGAVPAQGGSGSGAVVDPKGYVLTNNHVVEGARAISVRFADGAVREGHLLGTDRGDDLALLQVELPPGAAVAPLGDSDKVQVGETAIAIGSPFGLEGTVTQGIVSAVQRTWAPGSGRVRRGLLQTDAPINPGNSGGPLLNAAGEVIGINTMIESPVRGSVGVGFAVPINTARRVLPQLEAGARLEPVWLGVSGQDLDATIARDQGLAVQSGVLIVGIVPNSPAARAGLRGGQGQNERIPRGGDVITALDGQPVGNTRQLTEALAGRKPGDPVRLTIVRGGATQTLAVQLQAWPADQE
ncbi:MAG TPA: trypsin-like peptidase domain-containing protein [Chloroflexota bacterium]|jgi:S1-C subfamily serine protease|nr:trypsin-like peptidase domain-containing protein [Chloroflexota bacterium]